MAGSNNITFGPNQLNYMLVKVVNPFKDELKFSLFEFSCHKLKTGYGTFDRGFILVICNIMIIHNWVR